MSDFDSPLIVGLLAGNVILSLLCVTALYRIKMWLHEHQDELTGTKK